MARYTVSHTTAAGSSLPLINLTGSAAVRLHLYEFIVSFSATPADIATLLQIVRTDGVGTGGTPLEEVKLDPLTSAPVGAAIGGTFSGAPSKVADSTLFEQAFNQRGTWRWIAPPGGEFISVASANNGLEIESVSSGGTPATDVTMYWYE